MTDYKRILITGAAGRVGSVLAAGLKGRYDLRGCDRQPMPDLTDTVIGDLADMDVALRATEGMDAVAHLASTATRKAPWEEVLHSDIIATYNIYEAARQNGVPRVVFTSRAGIFEGYPSDAGITPDMPPRPIHYYSVGKVFGEALGYMYSHQYGLEVVCIRIGRFVAPDQKRAELPPSDKYLSARDAVQLYQCALTRPGVQFAVAFGVSQNSSGRYHNYNAWTVLGYVPRDSF